MDNLEKSIKDCISQELEKGIIEKVISEKLESCINSALSDMFGWRGSVSKVLEEKIKEVMIPYIEGYNYSNYIVKLDEVLKEILKSSALENKKILENFSELIIDAPDENIKMSDIFNKWTEYCKDNIDRNKIEFDSEGGYITTYFESEMITSGWNMYETYIVRFGCEEDEDLKHEFEIDRWKERRENFNLEYNKLKDIKSLRTLDIFEILLIKVSQGYNNLVLDITEDSNDTFIEYDEY